MDRTERRDGKEEMEVKKKTLVGEKIWQKVKKQTEKKTKKTKKLDIKQMKSKIISRRASFFCTTTHTHIRDKFLILTKFLICHFPQRAFSKGQLAQQK